MQMKVALLALALSLALSLLSGCLTVMALQNPETGALVRVGMSKAQVVEAWGEPKGKLRFNSPFIANSDMWEYPFAVVYFIQDDVVEKVIPRRTTLRERAADTP